MRVLITAGATRNKVDAIRYLSAHATGKTGVEMVTHLHDLFAREEQRASLFLLGSAEACLRLKLKALSLPWNLADSEEFFGTRDLLERMRLNVPLADVVIHSAAVGDYEMADSTDGKIHSGQSEVNLRLTPTPKILDQIRGWNPTCFLVSFKAASPGTSPENLVKIARAQLERTGSNLVFANVIGAQDSVWLVSKDESKNFQRSSAIRAVADAVFAHKCEVKWPILSAK